MGMPKSPLAKEKSVETSRKITRIARSKTSYNDSYRSHKTLEGNVDMNLEQARKSEKRYSRTAFRSENQNQNSQLQSSTMQKNNLENIDGCPKHRRKGSKYALRMCKLCEYSDVEGIQPNDNAKIFDEIFKADQNIKKFFCDKCEFSANLKGKLKEHVESVHEKIKQFSFLKCEYSNYYRN